MGGVVGGWPGRHTQDPEDIRGWVRSEGLL